MFRFGIETVGNLSIVGTCMVRGGTARGTSWDEKQSAHLYPASESRISGRKAGKWSGINKEFIKTS
jgi:hypothetical protein